MHCIVCLRILVETPYTLQCPCNALYCLPCTKTFQKCPFCSCWITQRPRKAREVVAELAPFRAFLCPECEDNRDLTGKPKTPRKYTLARLEQHRKVCEYQDMAEKADKPAPLLKLPPPPEPPLELVFDFNFLQELLVEGVGNRFLNWIIIATLLFFVFVIMFHLPIKA